MRGEQSLPPYNGKIGIGSPPLARGTGRRWVWRTAALGITPACAGNSSSFGLGGGGVWDHPRLRGEQTPKRLHCASCVGSPPLARGTVCNLPIHVLRRRITPACAGNSYPSLKCGYAHRDHPRLRGEQVLPASPRVGSLGSPPLARGTANIRHRFILLSRITPACAGNSFWCLVATVGRRDHPRLRGEQHAVST